MERAPDFLFMQGSFKDYKPLSESAAGGCIGKPPPWR
jgi:hypothetical protein